MTSTRLPRKVLAPVCGKPILEMLIERLARARTLDGIVIATTVNATDDPVADLAGRLGLSCFRGDEQNVLARYVGAARENDATTIVRITGDCPLIDPKIVDTVVARHFASGGDYTSNTQERTYPIGMDVEVFTRDALDQAGAESTDPDEQEHVTTFIYRRPKRFRLVSVIAPVAETDPVLRLTLDTSEDLELISRIFGELFPMNPTFTLKDVLALIAADPNLRDINRHVPHNRVSREQ
tara:strand:+ start:45658 stop:46371 length:714 start_codon:yes stop_codon:yes gene_type:complete